MISLYNKSNSLRNICRYTYLISVSSSVRSSSSSVLSPSILSSAEDQSLSLLPPSSSVSVPVLDQA